MKYWVALSLVLAAAPAAADPSFEVTAGATRLPGDAYAPELTTGLGFAARENLSLGFRLRAFRQHVPTKRYSDVADEGYNLVGVTVGPFARLDFADRRLWLAGGAGVLTVRQSDLDFPSTSWDWAAAFETRFGFTFARFDAESFAVSIGVTAYVVNEIDFAWSAALGYQFN